MSSHKRPLRLLTVLGAALLPPSILPLGFSVRRLSAVGSVQHDSLDKVASLAAAGVPRVVVLLRHGEKQAPAAPVDADTASDAEYWQGVNGVALTADGLLRSQELGKALRARGLEPGELLSSEVPRCVETIQAVAGSCDVPVQFRAALMNATHRPGEEKEAADEMRAVGWPAILERLCCDERVPGFLSLRETVQNLREACWPCQVVADTEGTNLFCCQFFLC